MKQIKKFKDEFIVIFNGDKFIFNDIEHRIHGVTGVDVDENKIQLRDDLVVFRLGKRKPIKFDDLIRLWSGIEPLLIPIVKKKELIKRKT